MIKTSGNLWILAMTVGLVGCSHQGSGAEQPDDQTQGTPEDDQILDPLPDALSPDDSADDGNADDGNADDDNADDGNANDSANDTAAQAPSETTAHQSDADSAESLSHYSRGD